MSTTAARLPWSWRGQIVTRDPRYRSIAPQAARRQARRSRWAEDDCGCAYATPHSGAEVRAHHGIASDWYHEVHIDRDATELACLLRVCCRRSTVASSDVSDGPKRNSHRPSALTIYQCRMHCESAGRRPGISRPVPAGGPFGRQKPAAFDSRRVIDQRWAPAHASKAGRAPISCRHGCRRKEPLHSDQRCGRSATPFRGRF